MAYREMTLDECLGALHPEHRARRELDDLRAKAQSAAARVAELETAAHEREAAVVTRLASMACEQEPCGDCPGCRMAAEVHADA